MALDFPNSPSNGTRYTAPSGVEYRYDGEKWITVGSQNALVDAVSSTGDTMTGNLTVPSLNSGQLAGFRNHLINGALQHWQRGVSAYVSGGSLFHYGSADRWGLFSDASGNSMAGSGTTDTPANGEFRYSISIDPSAASMGQRVELLSANAFRNGSTWSISCYSNQPLEFFCRETSATVVQNWVAMTPVTAADANGFRRYHHQFTFAHDCDNGIGFLEVLFRVPGATLARVTGFQLEPGPVATPFEHRPIGTELALCQRYFYSFVEGTSKHMFIATSATTAQIRGSISFPVTMRGIPTLVATSGSGYYTYYEGSTAAIDNAWTLWQPGTNSASISVALGSRTVGNSGQVYTSNAAASIAFDAEL